MRTIATKLYRVLQNGKTIHISLVPMRNVDLDHLFARDHRLSLCIKQEISEIPLITSEIVMWDGGDGLYPHLHFTCPRCSEIHNVDLEENDPNPRFGCCDSCSWDSLVWIAWNEDKLKKLTMS